MARGGVDAPEEVGCVDAPEEVGCVDAPEEVGCVDKIPEGHPPSFPSAQLAEFSCIACCIAHGSEDSKFLSVALSIVCIVIGRVSLTNVSTYSFVIRFTYGSAAFSVASDILISAVFRIKFLTSK